MIQLIYPNEPAPILPRPNVDNPGYFAAVSEEMLPVVEENFLVTGQSSRSYCHSGSGLLHPVVHLHILDREGRLYLQKRSLTKDLLPGCWDTAVGGHVAYGEQILEALYRESAEELSMTRFNPVAITNYIYKNSREREFIFVFACAGSFNPQPNPAEVSEGRYWTKEEIEDSLGKGIMTPNFEEEYGRISQQLYAIL